MDYIIVKLRKIIPHLVVIPYGNHALDTIFRHSFVKKNEFRRLIFRINSSWGSYFKRSGNTQ